MTSKQVLNSVLPAIGKTQAEAAAELGWTPQQISQKTVSGDGTTVVSVYYDRIMYKVLFHAERAPGSAVIDELTIEARYGEDIHDRWPKPSEGGAEWPTAWYTSPAPDPNGENVFVTGIGTMRKIVLPQAFKIVIPSLVNQFIITIKDTSILSIIGLAELVNKAKVYVGSTYQYMETYLFVAACYLVFTSLLMLLSRFVEKKLKYAKK